MNMRAAVALMAMVMFSATAQADGQTLRIELKGIEHEQGEIRVALFANAKSFRKADQAFASHQEPAKKGTMTLTFEEVPAGQYAVMVYHDENANGKLDLRFGMFPTEGYGLSNNPKVMGPPSFEDSEFTVATDTPSQIEIDIRY